MRHLHDTELLFTNGQAAKKLKKAREARVLRIKNRVAEPTPAGYRGRPCPSQ
jgi:hypothetical protein